LYSCVACICGTAITIQLPILRNHYSSDEPAVALLGERACCLNGDSSSGLSVVRTKAMDRPTSLQVVSCLVLRISWYILKQQLQMCLSRFFCASDTSFMIYPLDGWLRNCIIRHFPDVHYVTSADSMRHAAMLTWSSVTNVYVTRDRCECTRWRSDPSCF
jgi:hypothetical protein